MRKTTILKNKLAYKFNLKHHSPKKLHGRVFFWRIKTKYVLTMI